MKFSEVEKKQTIIYRLCDEVNCKSIATNVIKPGPGVEMERQLCDSHCLRYRAELRDDS